MIPLWKSPSELPVELPVEATRGSVFGSHGDLPQYGQPWLEPLQASMLDIELGSYPWSHPLKLPVEVLGIFRIMRKKYICIYKGF